MKVWIILINIDCEWEYKIFLVREGDGGDGNIYIGQRGEGGGGGQLSSHSVLWFSFWPCYPRLGWVQCKAGPQLTPSLAVQQVRLHCIAWWHNSLTQPLSQGETSRSEIEMFLATACSQSPVLSLVYSLHWTPQQPANIFTEWTQ